MEAEYKREIRDLQRRADFAPRAAGGYPPSRGASSGGSETAKNLQEAFKKENRVLQELATMSESLTRQGYA